MAILHGLGHGLDEAFFMVWETLWALVLGFALSGAVQAFVSRAEMTRALGDHRPVTLARASFFGVVSSSCSYASSALAKTLFARGADLTAALVFMVASTNLVVELGIVLWLLIGWQFAAAEFVGGFIMIGLLGGVLPRLIPESWIAPARAALNGRPEPALVPAEAASRETGTLRQRMASPDGWRAAAGFTVSDLRMLRRELVIGFVVAGMLAALVPGRFWQSLFWTGHGFASSLENALLGPLLAIISFVCSVGNVPLAAALWQGGSSFGGVVSFVFADLITLPLLAIYRKYFGTAITIRILLCFWAAMSTAGLAVQYLFRAVGISEPSRPMLVVRTGLRWNYTTILNLIALVLFAGLYLLHRSRRPETTDRYAEDPVCGMQVDKLHAPATATVGAEQFWFCSDHCQERFAPSAEGVRTPGDKLVSGSTGDLEAHHGA